MFFPALHLPLRPLAWDAGEAETAIAEIVGDALAAFDAERFWPAHRLEDGVPDGNTSFYIGATGMIWALSYLKRVGATQAAIDFHAVLPHLLEANKAEFGAGMYPEHGSLLFGDLGTALVVMQLAPSKEIAQLIYRTADANTPLPIRELMWGLPGSMIACVHMTTLTGEPRWRELFAVQATRLLSELEESPEGPLWTQDLYGSHLRLLGAVHGFAGNMIPLLRGWDWLDDRQRTRVADVSERIPESEWQRRTGLFRRWGGRGHHHGPEPFQILRGDRAQFELRLQGSRRRRTTGGEGPRRPLCARRQRATGTRPAAHRRAAPGWTDRRTSLGPEF
jgi:hypothetical protein